MDHGMLIEIGERRRRRAREQYLKDINLSRNFNCLNTRVVVQIRLSIPLRVIHRKA